MLFRNPGLSSTDPPLPRPQERADIPSTVYILFLLVSPSPTLSRSSWQRDCAPRDKATFLLGGRSGDAEPHLGLSECHQLRISPFLHPFFFYTLQPPWINPFTSFQEPGSNPDSRRRKSMLTAGPQSPGHPSPLPPCLQLPNPVQRRRWNKLPAKARGESQAGYFLCDPGQSPTKSQQ